MTKEKAKPQPSKTPPESKTYEVGYKRPPVKHQFQPGKSGNPSGRRARRRSPEEYLSNMMAKLVAVSENGASKKMTRIEALLHRMFATAFKGDHRAAETIVKLLSKQAAVDAKKVLPFDPKILTDEELDVLIRGGTRWQEAQMNAEIEQIKKKYKL